MKSGLLRVMRFVMRSGMIGLAGAHGRSRTDTVPATVVYHVSSDDSGSEWTTVAKVRTRGSG